MSYHVLCPLVSRSPSTSMPPYSPPFTAPPPSTTETPFTVASGQTVAPHNYVKPSNIKPSPFKNDDDEDVWDEEWYDDDEDYGDGSEGKDVPPSLSDIFSPSVFNSHDVELKEPFGNLVRRLFHVLN